MALDRPRTPRSLVVVGNGPVGFMFCRNLLHRAHAGSFRLTVFGEEPRPAYDRIRLTDLFSGTSVDELQFSTRDWYEQYGVTLYTGEPIVEIVRRRQIVRSITGREVPYDLLVLATGSRAHVPPVLGCDLPGVFVYRTLEDVLAIQRAVVESRSAIILGGGLLGLEAAKALMDQGLKTHLVEKASVLMPKQLDTQGANLLIDLIRKTGVHVHLLKRTDRIEREGNRLAVHFDDDSSLSADLVVLSAGIRPRDELARACGLEVAETAYGGILVDDRLRTSDPHIFAIGECVVHRGQIYGLAGPGYFMAEVLAKNLTGENAAFEGGDVSTRLKVMGIDLSLCGDYLDTSDAQTEVHSASETYRKLILRGRRLVGVVSVGESPELPWIQAAINEKRRLSPRRLKRFRKEGLLWPKQTQSHIHTWPSGAVVCSCMGITRGTLSEAFAEGCQSVEQLAEFTRASTVCGSCKPLLAELVGTPIPVENSTRRRWLLGVSLSACLLVALLAFWGPLPVADSVQSHWHQFGELWRNTNLRRTTGFTVLGISCLTLLLPLRKRLGWFERISFPTWRVIHALLGVTALLGLAVHTGFRLGTHLNLWLMIAFLGTSLFGAATGAVASWETSATGQAAQRVRVWRPRLALVHIALCWPLPVLIVFHILMTFYF